MVSSVVFVLMTINKWLSVSGHYLDAPVKEFSGAVVSRLDKATVLAIRDPSRRGLSFQLAFSSG